MGRMMIAVAGLQLLPSVLSNLQTPSCIALQEPGLHLALQRLPLSFWDVLGM